MQSAGSVIVCIKLLPFVLLLGNNIFGDELRQVLGGIKDKASRSAYILMDRIKPQVVKNYLLQSGAAVKLSECVVELGVFGVYIR